MPPITMMMIDVVVDVAVVAVCRTALSLLHYVHQAGNEFQFHTKHHSLSSAQFDARNLRMIFVRKCI